MKQQYNGLCTLPHKVAWLLVSYLLSCEDRIAVSNEFYLYDKT